LACFDKALTRLWQCFGRLWHALACFDKALTGFGMIWQALTRLWQCFGRLWQCFGKVVIAES
jgi:hypothetical protein